MTDLKLSFTVDEMPLYDVSFGDGVKTIEIEAKDGTLCFGVRYDSHSEMLMLRGYVKLGDVVCVILMDHRIELYVNEMLVDEEWPNGARLFDLGDGFDSGEKIKVELYCDKKHEELSVCGVFYNAEGWKPEENVFVGDCMPYVRDDEYHVLYLKDRHHHCSKWGMGAHQWAHISTHDFEKWQIHPMAVEITDPSEGSICTGSWIRHNGREYLYYTVRRGGTLAAPIRRSVSVDGYRFEKDENYGFVLPEKYDPARARDPKVIRDENGLFHMIITTSLVAEGKGCLAHFVSDDLQSWQDTEKPIYISDDGTEPECPDYIFYKNRYYLIFSLNARARYMISDSAFDGWRMPKDPEIPCESVPKCAIWEDKIVFAGYRGNGGYAGTMTFKTATADESGELIFL